MNKENDTTYCRKKLKSDLKILFQFCECAIRKKIQWFLNYGDDGVQKYQKIVVLRISGSLKLR